MNLSGWPINNYYYILCAVIKPNRIRYCLNLNYSYNYIDNVMISEREIIKLKPFRHDR